MLETRIAHTLPQSLEHLCEFLASLSTFRDENGRKFEQLTNREIEILEKVAFGRTNQETADELGISLGTVQKHRSTIKRKLEIGNSFDYVTYAMAFGLMDELYQKLSNQTAEGRS